MIAGGGFRAGMVRGETPANIPVSRTAEPADPISIPQLMATIMKSMGIDSSQEINTPIGRPMRLADAQPINDLLLPSG